MAMQRPLQGHSRTGCEIHVSVPQSMEFRRRKHEIMLQGITAGRIRDLLIFPMTAR